MELAAVTERINRCNCNLGGVIGITSNLAMSNVVQEQLVCLKNGEEFFLGIEGEGKDSAEVLPDDRVLDIKELQVLNSPPSAQVLAVPHDPAIIQVKDQLSNSLVAPRSELIKKKYEDTWTPDDGCRDIWYNRSKEPQQQSIIGPFFPSLDTLAGGGGNAGRRSRAES